MGILGASHPPPPGPARLIEDQRHAPGLAVRGELPQLPRPEVGGPDRAAQPGLVAPAQPVPERRLLPGLRGPDRPGPDGRKRTQMAGVEDGEGAGKGQCVLGMRLCGERGGGVNKCER